MTPDAQHLDLLAATQIIADGEVAHCWELVRVGIQTLKIGTGNLGRLIGHLRAGNGMTLDELTLEVDPPGSDRMVVAILDDQRTCSAPKMIEELARLAGRASAPSPAGAPSGGGAPPSSSSPGTRAAEPDAPDLLGLIAGLLVTTPDRLAGDPDAYRAQVERVRAAAARWREVMRDPHSDLAAREAAATELRAILSTASEHGASTAADRARDLERAVNNLGVEPDRVAAALRTISDWLEERTPAAGAAVDLLIAALEQVAAPFLGRLAAGADEAERDRRIRESARAAIASRIKLS